MTMVNVESGIAELDRLCRARLNVGDTEGALRAAGELLRKGGLAQAGQLIVPFSRFFKASSRCLEWAMEVYKRSGDWFGLENAARAMLSYHGQTPAALFALALALHETRRFEHCLDAVERALEKLPGNGKLNALAASACFELDDFKPAEAYVRSALEVDEGTASNYLLLCDILAQTEREADAVEVLRAGMDNCPFHPGLAKRLAKGLILMGDKRRAAEVVTRMLSERGDLQDYQLAANIALGTDGSDLSAMGDYFPGLDASSPMAVIGAANYISFRGEHDQALKLLKSCSPAPGHEAEYALAEASILRKLGKFNAALAVLGRFQAEIQKGGPMAEEMADIMNRSGDPGAAAKLCGDLLGAGKGGHGLYMQMGKACQALGDRVMAVEMLTRALMGNYRDMINRVLFSRSADCVDFNQFGPWTRVMLTNAVRQHWANPAGMLTLGISLVKDTQHVLSLGKVRFTGLDPEDPDGLVRLADQASADTLLMALWSSSVAGAVSLEAAVRTLRRFCLGRLEKGDTEPPVPLRLMEAIALQAFYTEYAYPVEAEEREVVERLAERLNRSQRPVEELVPAFLIYAMFRGLGTLERMDSVSPDSCPVQLSRVFEVQVADARRERELRADIKSLSEIEDEVSIKVRDQYEENPYPRWPGLARYMAFPDLISICAKDFPLLDRDAPLNWDRPQCLFAGCGTGMQTLNFANVPGVRITAVDLSLSSIAYASRQAEALEIDNVDFYHADILNLNLGRDRFDYVESTGVIHHMEKPELGLASLAEVLRPGGVLRLALYSTKARWWLEGLRDIIRREGFESTRDGIRAFRDHVLSRPLDKDSTELVKFRDFYSLSDCRDLCFHVQEHTYTVAELRRLVEGSGLRLVGFVVNSAVLRAIGLEDDPANLADWDFIQEIEDRAPEAFVGMFAFGLQKPY